MTTITALPTPPSRQDPLNFATRSDAFLGQLPQFGTECNAVASEVNTYASNASTSATNAGASATAAATAATAAQSAANYKGEWSSLVGVLNTPATVSYQGRFYVLTTNLSDVTTHTPGVSSVWVITNATEKLLSISTNTTVGVFGYYRVTAAINVTLPAAPADGQWVDFLNETGTNNFIILRNGKTIMGLAQDLTVNVNHKSFRMVYFSSSNDWWIKA